MVEPLAILMTERQGSYRDDALEIILLLKLENFNSLKEYKSPDIQITVRYGAL